MSHFLYCLAYPMEALVASMLSPEEFATYLAIGTKKMARGKVVLLEIQPDFKPDAFDWEKARRKCVPGPHGEPKSSVYLSIYRVLERLPLEAIKTLYLVTRDGLSLAIAPQRIAAQPDHPRRESIYLYQELCPVRPLVVSCLDPLDFGQRMTDPQDAIRVPRLLFARMKLSADLKTVVQDTSLPYSNLPHIQNCVNELLETKKEMKTVERAYSEEFFYTALLDGLYLAERGSSLFFPFPKELELKDKYYRWWRSAV